MERKRPKECYGERIKSEKTYKNKLKKLELHFNRKNLCGKTLNIPTTGQEKLQHEKIIFRISSWIELAESTGNKQEKTEIDLMLSRKFSCRMHKNKVSHHALECRLPIELKKAAARDQGICYICNK